MTTEKIRVKKEIKTVSFKKNDLYIFAILNEYIAKNK